MQEQSYNHFYYFQIFFNFFLYFFSLCAKFPIYAGCPVFLPFPAVVCSVGVLVLCRLWSCAGCGLVPDDYLPTNQIHARMYIHVRGFLDSNF